MFCNGENFMIADNSKRLGIVLTSTGLYDAGIKHNVVRCRNGPKLQDGSRSNLWNILLPPILRPKLWPCLQQLNVVQGQISHFYIVVFIGPTFK